MGVFDGIAAKYSPALEENSGGAMQETEKELTHANCGGKIRLQTESQHYVCDRCHAEAEGIISSSEAGEGKAEEVTLCNPHDDNF
jgi:hypothetical protein